MNIIWYLLGCASGLGVKLAIDQYHYFKANQDAQDKQLEAWAIELREIRAERGADRRSEAERL